MSLHFYFSAPTGMYERHYLRFKKSSRHGTPKTFYLGDRPIDLLGWVNGFSRALTGRDVRIVPRPLMRGLALLGDIPTAVTGKPFLINRSRLRSMTTDYRTPMEPTFELLSEKSLWLPRWRILNLTCPGQIRR